MVNLIAFRATVPADMMTADDPVGPDCDKYLLAAFRGGGHMGGECRMIVPCWGADGTYRDRWRHVAALLDGYYPMCFGLTKSGQPLHPLYLAANRPLVPYEPPL